ncbi:hypothetical protein Glove_199g12 [Diversispora epigaea]|uniref:TLDc domain-containing protein n=1 Tax=Diversispora epigaea TaxID=1348612 RepID=A0A397IMM2_9GLOM|nr:hypothetical protein Glove_199g12 [Diversispora epigaea]
MSFKFFDKLSQNFIELLDYKEDHNVIIIVENKKSFTANSCVLKCRSTYKELENIMPNENDTKTITMPNISDEIFDIIIKYIYGGIVNFENVETRFIFDLMITVNELEIEELTKKLENYLIEAKSSWLKSHFSLVYRSIFNGNNFKNLEKFCNDIVAKYPNLIFDTEDFVSLQESALVSLLKRDDLQLEEVIIWEYVIKWGIAQNSTLPNYFIRYIYGGIVNFENVETRFIFDLMITVNELEIEELTKKLENYLIEAKSSWLKSHFSLVYRSIFNGNNFKNLEKFCNDIVAKYPNLIFDTEDFVSLQESALVSLLKRDDLQLEEVIIWEYVIKWGIAQNSTLPVDLQEWTKENFTTLKTTLQQCLSLIRYFHIPGTDVLKKVKPYKRILDKQLWEDLNQYFWAPDEPVKSVILPPRSILVQELPTRTTEPAKPLSTIITYEHVTEISSWIDRKSNTYSLTNIPYEFQLILRGSINGFAPQTFWDICNGQSGTVVIIKVKGTDEILGGYNPLAWDITNKTIYDWGAPNYNWKKTNDSFIFSLKNGDVQNSILSRVKVYERAIYNVNIKDWHKYHGPHFGYDLYMYGPSSNFILDDTCICNNNCRYYEKPLRTAPINFSIVDYEVFKVIKKAS